MKLKYFTKNYIFFIAFAFINSTIANAEELTEIQQLGELLFFDKNLSINRNQSCGTCHAPASFVDPANTADPTNSVISLGSDGGVGSRNTPTITYAAFSPAFQWFGDSGVPLFFGGQFLDGRVSSLEEQAKQPFLNPIEMGLPSEKAVLRRIASWGNDNRRDYKRLFRSVFGANVNRFRHANKFEADTYFNMVASAIAEFERSKKMNQFSSKYDHFLAGNVELTESEANGLELFNGKAFCSICHVSATQLAPDGVSTFPPLFTDCSYSNIGIPKSDNPAIADNPPDLGLGERADIVAMDTYGIHKGAFKTNGLRNIELTAPYGHNGVFATLEEIVSFYNTRDVPGAGWPAPEVSENVITGIIGDLGLTPEEEADLVAFMKTLTDGFGEPLNDFPFPPFAK